MASATHGRRGRPWRRLRAQVLREEPVCRYCGLRPSTVVDHVLALSKYPHLAQVRSNLVGSCKPCNGSKGNKEPGQWTPAQRARRRPSSSVTRLTW